MRDKIFLTGERQIGKSTVIDRVLAQLHCSVGGFRTGFVDESRRELRLVSVAAGESTPVMERGEAGTRIVHTQGFETLGAASLQEQAALIVTDELGFLEEDAHRFQTAVLQALDGDVPVLGVLRQDKQGWLDAVRSHPRVQLMTVTAENRDGMPAEVLEMLAKLGLR